MRYGRAIPGCLLLLGMLGVPAPTAAQSSASFEVGEAVWNAGGDPAQGVKLTSASFTISLDSLGDALAGSRLSGPFYQVDGGLVSSSGETLGLHFASKIDLLWDPEPAAVGYRLYRGTVGDLPGPSGDCIAAPAPGQGVNDPALPGSGVLRRARGEADPLIVGVAAASSETGADGSCVRVATYGVVEARADAGFGEIRPGDLLTASPTPGHAARATESWPGTLLGKALDPLATGTGTVRVLLMPR